MAEHNIFLGGLSTRNWFYQGLPSTEQTPNGAMTGTTHKHQGRFSLNRHLIWKDSDCGPATGCKPVGSLFLADYIANHEIKVGDILNIMMLPKQTSLLGVWWKVTTPLEGFTFSLRARGNANSLGGALAAPAPRTIATALDGAAAPVEDGHVPSGLIGIDPAMQGDPLAPGIYFDQNDMLQLVVDTLPPEGIACSDLTISAVMESYCEGSF